MASRTGNTPTPPLLAEAGRSSPPPACAICLGQFKNKSFTETCLHQFCFNCLLEWSKIKAECPLCKQPFTTIIHSVRSNDVYDKYVIQQPLPPNDLEFTSEIMYSRRFRYRTTLTLHTRESIAIQRLLDSLPTDSSLNANNHGVNSLNPSFFRNQITHSIIFRRRVYHQNMWAHPLPDITGRFRESSPEIYRNNPSELNRLVPWITRELSALLVDPTSISYVLNEILTKLSQHAIRSRAFLEFITTYIPFHTDQFIHELYQFARTPFDMRGYDRYVSYGVGNPVVVDSYVNEISSSEENNSTDSDVLVVGADAGPSNSTNNALSEPSTSSWNNGRSLGCPVVIESIRQSDTDESSDAVILVMCKKPPHERTPEIVDLVASDSDAIIIDEPRPSSVTCVNIGTQSDRSSPGAPSTSGVRSAFKRRFSSTLFSSDTDSDSPQPSVNKSSLIRNTLLRKYKSRISAGSDSDSDSDSSSTMTSSSSSSSWSNSKKTSNGDQKYHELSLSKKNHDNKIINALFSKIARSQSASSNSQGPSSVKKHKHKKSKHKKRTKKNHKHKSKSKKRSRSNEKSVEKLYKGKFCNKSKMKNKQTSDSQNEAKPYWPALDSDSSSSAQENDSKKKTMKSVITSVPSVESESKTSLLDLMSIAVLSSNSVLAIKNKEKDNNGAIHLKESPRPDNDSSDQPDMN